jgi:peptidoglycan hydrolase CwlO-like protein
MKSILRSILLATVFASVSSAQTPDEQLFNLIQQLTAKQTELADNQGKIENKVGNLAETVRTARILMSRAGGKHKPPPPPK